MPIKPEAMELLRAKQDPVSIEEITLLDWFAAFALMGTGDLPPEVAAKIAYEKADAMLHERVQRV